MFAGVFYWELFEGGWKMCMREVVKEREGFWRLLRG